MLFIIIGALLFYFSWAVVKIVTDIKKGKSCSCGCNDCPAKNKCGKN